MFGFIFLFIVLILAWLPLTNVHASKLNTEDIQIANSILQRLHRLQEQKKLNDRIKKQRLEEVNNHNERVKFLHKLSLGAKELPIYSPEEEKNVNDLFEKLQQEELLESIKKIDVAVLQKALAVLQKNNDDKSKKDSTRKKMRIKIKKRVTLPMFSEIGNKRLKSPLSLLQEKFDLKPLPSSVWDKTINNNQPLWRDHKSESGESTEHDQDQADPFAIGTKDSNEDNEDTPAFSWPSNSVNTVDGIKQSFIISGEDEESVLDKVKQILKKQKQSSNTEPPVLKWKSHDKGNFKGFLNGVDLNQMLQVPKSKDADKNNKILGKSVFKDSSYEDTVENNNEIINSNDKLDGYSKVFVVLDPAAISTKNDKSEANKIISKLSTWASKLNKYWEPRMQKKKSSRSLRRRRPEYSNEDQDDDGARHERPLMYRSNKRHHRGSGGGGGGNGGWGGGGGDGGRSGGGIGQRISRTAAPFVHPRGDIYDRNND